MLFTSSSFQLPQRSVYIDRRCFLFAQTNSAYMLFYERIPSSAREKEVEKEESKPVQKFCFELSKELADVSSSCIAVAQNSLFIALAMGNSPDVLYIYQLFHEYSRMWTHFSFRISSSYSCNFPV